MSKERKRSNRTLQQEKRQQKLKELILRLHEGEGEESVKADFRKYFKDVSALEISVMERRLIADEGIHADDIMKLCNVHAAIFLENIQLADETPHDFEKPGHPVHVLKQENIALEGAVDRIERLLEFYVTDPAEDVLAGLKLQAQILWEIDKHYARKENSWFPIMEANDITAPPKVMWGVDDMIRDLIKEFMTMLEQNKLDQMLDHYAETKYEILEMIVKEEDILIPMVTEVFTEDDWMKIADEMDEIGYCIVKPEEKWVPERTDFEAKDATDESMNLAGNLKLGHGALTLEEADLILDQLPLELTFVDKHNKVKYFNRGEKILPRTPNAIGRDVFMCHPPRVHDTVKQLLEELRDGTRDTASAWFEARDTFVMITYDAIRDKNGEYLGCLEYVQDISGIKQIDTEKKDVFDEA